MALTAKPIATISYNTEPHLKRVLDAFLASARIEDYRYIRHEGEDGDKDHIHLIVFPNKRMDTVEFQQAFNEMTVDHDKPLGCLPFRISKPDHWLMYALHDPHYLSAHKSDNDGDGKIEYQLSDIVTPYPEQLERDYRKAIQLRHTENQQIIEALMRGDSAAKVAYENSINPMKIAVLNNLIRQEFQMGGMNEAMRDHIFQLQAEVGKLQQNQRAFMLADLEQKTGLDLHNDKVDVFEGLTDEDILSNIEADPNKQQ